MKVKNSICLINKVLLLIAFILIPFYNIFSQTINFDDQGYIDDENLGATFTLTSNGQSFDFSLIGTTPYFGYDLDYNFCDPYYTNGQVMPWSSNNDLTTLIIKTTDGADIKFNSFDFINNFDCFPYIYEIQVDGYKDGGSTPIGTFSGSMNLTSNTVNLGSNFESIDEIRVSASGATPNLDGSGIDNIVWAPPPNTNPDITISGTSISYIENTAALQIDALGTLEDSDGDSEWDGGRLEAQITSNAETSDEISISDSDADTIVITISGTNIFANSTDIGDLSTSGGIVTNGTKLTITFDSDATNSIVQEVLQSIQYRNISEDPGTSNRTVTFTATDKNSGSNSGTRTISITPINDSPTLTATGTDPTFTEGESAVILYNSASASTIESGQEIDSLILTITNINDGAQEILSIDGSHVTLTNANSLITTNNINVVVNITGTTATVSISKLTGISTSDIQTLINGITYQNTSTTPNTSNRIVTITKIADNGSYTGANESLTDLTISSTISIVAVDPPLATTLAATSILGTSAVLNGSINANNASTTTGFEYGLTSSYGTSVSAIPSPVTGSTNTHVSSALTGLVPNTTYHYRVIGVNSGGTSNGADLTFTTLAIAPTAITNTATSINGTGATINGTVNANNDFSTISFEFGLTTAYGTTVSSIPSSTSGTTNTSASSILTGLTPNTTYHYRVIGANSAGTSNGTDLTFTTLAIVSTVTTTPATSVSGTEVTLNGTVNANNDTTTVSFEYGLTTSYGTTVASIPSVVSNITNTSVSSTLTGLIPNTTYHYRVVGINSAGTSNGADLTFTTMPILPVVTTNTATTITGTEVTLNGMINANNSSTSANFEYGLTTSYNYFATSNPSTVNGTTNVSISSSITGLIPNTTYHFRAVGINSAGTSNGADITFATATIIPTVTTTAASNISSTSATINGVVNANNANTTVSFEYGLTAAYGSLTTSNPSSVNGTSNTSVSSNLNGLLPNTTYHYRVIGVNSAGTTYGDDFTFLTPNCTNPTSGGIIASNQTICFGETPESLTNLMLPSGGIGILEFKWQSSETNSTTGFSDILSTNSVGYSPGNLTKKTWFKRLARVNCMTDWSGAIESNVIEITVNDLPDANCQDITVFLNSTGNISIDPSDIDNSSSYDCGFLSMTLNKTDFSCTDVGLNTISLTVADVNNNTSTCSATVTVWDTVSPDAVCQDITIYLDELGLASIVAGDVDGGSTDACGILSLAVDSTSFDCGETGANTVVLTVTDVNGNTSTCEATVTVLDTISPDFASCSNLNDTIDCLGEVGNEIAAAEWDLLNIESLEGCVIDNCEIDTVKSDYDWANFVDSCCNAGGLTVVYTAVDISGNSSTFTAYLSIIDTMPPTFTAPNDTTIYVDENCEYDSDVVYTGDVTDESDICCETLDATYSDVVVAGDCPGNWIITRTWSLIDGCGNEADDQIQIINVEDTIPPDVVCNAIEIVLYENGEHTLHEGEIIAMAAGTTDNCTSFEDLEIIVEPRGFECIHVGEPVDVKVTVIDLCGNEASCWTTVTVYDETPPIALCKDLDLVLDESGEARINPSMVNAGDGNAIPPGWARTYNGLASGSYDACGISLLNIDQYNFDCSDIGENTVTLTVVDAHGNTSTCESTVTVSDNMVPVIEPVSDVELVIEPGSCDSELEYPTLVIHDNCETTQELVEGLGSNGMFPVGTTTETWKVTDDAGNIAMVSFNVTIVATNAQPTINEQTDITVVEDTYSVDVTLTGISEGDDCEEQEVMITANGDNPDLITSVMVDYTTGDSTGVISMMIAPEMSGEAEIVVTVEDEEGGITTDTFTVTVTPVNDAPYLVATIADHSVHASHVLKVPVSSVLGVLFDDIDDDMLTIKVMAEGSDSIPHWATMMGDTLVFEPLIADTGCVNIVITASDAGGLSVSDTFEICVDGFPVSIGDIGMNKFEVNMYPNPSKGEVNLEISSGIYDIELTVHDMTGRTVMRKQYSAAEKITFDMTGNVSGMYFVKIQTNGKQIVKKLILDKK